MIINNKKVSKIFVAIISLIIIYWLINIFKKNIIFRTKCNDWSTPSIFNIHYEDIYINIDKKVKLHAWLIHPQKNNGYVILYSHGNAGNISNRINILNILERLGFTVLIYDYRGYGKSTGKPNEKNLYNDIEIIWDYMIKNKNFNPNKIILYGESLGCTISLYLASKLDEKMVPYKCTVLQSPFESLRKLCTPYLPGYFAILCLFVKEFNTSEIIRNNYRPILFVHSKQDTIIPYKHTELLASSINNKKEIITINGDHNTPIFDNEYKIKLLNFIRSC